MSLIYSPLFKDDLVSCMEWSLEFFGQKASDRYAKLIEISIQEISLNPELMGSRDFEDGVRLYHIRHSKEQAAIGGKTVKKPRHFIAYRAKESSLQLIRLLHESMDVSDHFGELND